MSRRVAIIHVANLDRILLTESPHAGANGDETHLQLTVWPSMGRDGPAGSVGTTRLTPHQAGELETALHNWLTRPGPRGVNLRADPVARAYNAVTSLPPSLPLVYWMALTDAERRERFAQTRAVLDELLAVLDLNRDDKS